MNPRTKHSWLAWLLPLMVLRAFVPAGFMLSWSSDGPQLVVCTGSGPAVTWAAGSDKPGAHNEPSHHTSEMSQAGGHHHHEGAAGKVHENSYCPYALAASASAPPVLDAFVSEVVPTEAIDVVSHSDPQSAAVLIDRIRGPPRV